MVQGFNFKVGLTEHYSQITQHYGKPNMSKMISAILYVH